MDIADVQKLTPALNWADYFKQQGAPGLAKLNVSQPAFLKALQTELSDEDVAALRAYLRFHLLTATAPYLAAPFEQAYFGFFSTTLHGIPQMPPRWKTCTRGVDRALGEALGQEFVRRTFTAETKAKTQLMTRQIEAKMQHEIENLDWMSPATKEEALRKLHAIRNKIGYPDKWRDYTALEVKPNDYAGRRPPRLPLQSGLRMGQARQARQSGRVGHESAHRQRLLQSPDERHQLSRRRSAAAALRSQA